MLWLLCRFRVFPMARHGKNSNQIRSLRLLQAYADECAWRENHRREANGAHWNLITGAALAAPKSERWTGYWHREKAA